VTVNPLVVPAIDQPTDIWAGVWIAEDIELIVQGIRNNSWVDTSLGSIGAALDGLAFVSDPGGAVLQYFAAWAIEHFRPLTDVLDWLAGDPGEIAGHAQTWRNVSTLLHSNVDDLRAALAADVGTWGGEAGPTYRAWAQLQQSAVDGLASACEAMATITECAGYVVAAVRIMVRDLIAIAFSRAISYLVELGFSGGFAAPLVVEQVTTLALSTGGRIARLLRGLIESLRRLFEAVPRLLSHIDELKAVLARLAREDAGELRLPGGGYQTPRPGTAEWIARRDELAIDPAHGGSVSPKGTREAEIALDLEASGVLPGPVRRGGIDNSNPSAQADMGDFIDATGQAWDIKAPTDIFPAGPLAGEPMTPGQPGRYEGATFEESLAEELDGGENVILDTRNLSPDSLADLRARVANHPEWSGKVVFHS
jgi:uncharacterized protein YukE